MSAPNEFEYKGTTWTLNMDSIVQGVIKVKTLDELYNLMMEPRILTNGGILKEGATTGSDITSKVLETGYSLGYLPTDAKNKPRLVLQSELPSE